LFDAILNEADATRATWVVHELLDHGLRGALTGSLAIAVRLRTRGRPREARPLNDIDFVLGGFADIPESLADRFLLNHVHPAAPEGKMLMQVIDAQRAVRVDLFRARGATLSRSSPVGADPLDVVSLEDLVARTTAHVYGHLRAGRVIEEKYVRSFLELSPFATELPVEEAWQDHREDVASSFAEAATDARSLLALYPELIVAGEYSSVIVPCERCCDHGRFRRAAPERIVEVLGYW
jgi:hypothetical protein